MAKASLVAADQRGIAARAICAHVNFQPKATAGKSARAKVKGGGEKAI